MLAHGTIKDHVLELKKRIIYILLFFIVAFMGCYLFSNQILDFIIQPLLAHGSLSPDQLIFTNLTEPFFTYLHLSAITAMTCSIPFTLWQIYCFVQPAMLPTERHIALLMMCGFVILVSLGMAFAYYVVIPKAWGFFLSYQQNNTELPLILQAKISEYALLIINLFFAFALAFQLPNILIMLTLLGLLSSQTLRKSRRIAIIIIFALAAILTPPDIFSQIALALPMILLYEISILICCKVEKRKR